MNKLAAANSLTLIIMFLSTSLMPAEAQFRRVGRVGPNGAIGAGGGNYVGANGGAWRGGHAGFVTPNSGLLGGAFKGAGPNGGTGQGAGVAGWKRGVGGFEKTGMSLNGPGGSTYKGNTKGYYNAQTGQGAYNASHQSYDAQNGKNYGDTNNTSYSNGKGVTQLNTDNHGDYTVDWAKGQQPTVVKDPSQQ